jgi:hypothetical protein
MDKVMKAEIEKVEQDYAEWYMNWADRFSEAVNMGIGGKLIKQQEDRLSQVTSSLTALIIKWLEGKRGQQCLASGEYERNKMFGRNQLITELVEELK